MKLLITALVIVCVAYAVFHFVVAAYGWFELSGVVDEVANTEIPRLADRASTFGATDRLSSVRRGILKGAKEAGVDLRPENVSVAITNNMLDINLTWTAPIASYRGTTYLEVPMSMQRVFALNRPVPVR